MPENTEVILRFHTDYPMGTGPMTQCRRGHAHLSSVSSLGVSVGDERADGQYCLTCLGEILREYGALLKPVPNAR